MNVEELNLSDYIDDVRRELRAGALIGKKGDELISCHKLSCRECDFYHDLAGCHFQVLNFLFTRKGEDVIPYRLTDEEKHFLLCLSSKYEWMARDIKGALICFENKPILQSNGYWSYNGEAMEIITEVFQNTNFNFVKACDPEPWKISLMHRLVVGISDSE